MKHNNNFDDTVISDDDFEIEDADENADAVADAAEGDLQDALAEESEGAEEDIQDADEEGFEEEPEGEEPDSDVADAVSTNTSDDYSDEDFENNEGDDEVKDDSPKKKHTVRNIGWALFALIVIFAVWALGTNSGRNFCMGFVARFVHENVGTDAIDEEEEQIIQNDTAVPEDEITGTTVVIDEQGNTSIIDADGNVIEQSTEPRSEDYVKTYLIFGIETINGAANTDAMMLVSLNTKDNTIKVTSLLRDTYVSIPGWDTNKLNSAYAKGAHGAETGAEARANGAALLVRTIEETYRIKIDGYASVNFSRFEKIIDRLGGIDIELGEKEAKYLNKTNYISKPENRNVVAGWNHLNGNQVMGYVRVRKVETLEGVDKDYGRTLRQRKVIKAIINKYKSAKLSEIMSITKDCLGYVYTNLTEEQIQETLTMIVNNGMYTMKSLRLPADGLFYDSEMEGIFNGSKKITYALVMGDNLEDNIKKLHQFVFLDEE